MFDSLKKKLQNIRTKLTSNIEEAAGTEPESLTVDEVGEVRAVEPAPSSASPEQEEVPSPAQEEPTFFNRLKVLVREREVLLQEKDIEGPLFELEMVLLENDVA
ncbi:MAG: signal recognition particle-docking protein FtsY, partial [Methanoculleus sp.]|nr:signal recognition particle-docking protein FtsY [Methanoculleus sp.]